MEKKKKVKIKKLISFKVVFHSIIQAEFLNKWKQT